MKRFNFKIISVISSLLFYFICCANRNSSLEKINTDVYSGVYEGRIDFSMCCEVYETGEGWIAFNFSEKPIVVLYDGVFLENIVLQGNKLISNSEFPEYPNNIIGVFGESNGKKGFWYNHRDADASGSAGKVF